MNTHTFIPHRVHEAIGVLGSVSVATACVLPGTVASEYVSKPVSNTPSSQTLTIEHPTGAF
ncbi:4-oxalomesaconate tautomerase, partial [Alteromonas sp. LMIT007]|nr:4-oxalomesaconate tautomerase [Opacimonas viscosa]